MEIFLCVKKKKKKKMCYVDRNENNIYVLIYFKWKEWVVLRGKVYSRVQIVFIFESSVIIIK
jgi:hypothetical protein